MSLLKFAKKFNCYTLNVHTALVALNYLMPQLLPTAKLLMHLLQFYATLKSVIADLTVHQRLTLQKRTEQKILLSSVVYRTEDSLVFNCLQNTVYTNFLI